VKISMKFSRQQNFMKFYISNRGYPENLAVPGQWRIQGPPNSWPFTLTKNRVLSYRYFRVKHFPA